MRASFREVAWRKWCSPGELEGGATPVAVCNDRGAAHDELRPRSNFSEKAGTVVEILVYILIPLAVIFGAAIAYDLRGRRRRSLSGEFGEAGADQRSSCDPGAQLQGCA